MPRGTTRKKQPIVDGPSRIDPRSPYRHEMVEQVYEWGLLGLTKEELAREFGVSSRLIDIWMNVHPEFGEAVRRSRIPADGRVARSLLERATGYSYTDHEAVKVRKTIVEGKTRTVIEEVVVVEVPKFMPPDTASMAIWLRNRQPERWRDSRKVEFQGTLEHRLAAMTPAERDAWSVDLEERAMRLLEAPAIEHQDIEPIGEK